MQAKLYVARQADQFNLEVAIPGTDAVNSWDIWVYPKDEPAEPASDILIARELSDEAVKHLDAGGKVLLLPSPQTIKNDREASDPDGLFEHLLEHGLDELAGSAHAGHPVRPGASGPPPVPHGVSYELAVVGAGPRRGAVHSHRVIAIVKPIVQVIDDWVTARKLALVFEARVGNGKLLACSCDLTSDLDKRPVARQMRRSLLAYMAGEQFAPQFSMTIAAIGRPLRGTQPAGEARRDRRPRTIITSATVPIWPSTAIRRRSGTRTGSPWPSRRTI